MSLSRFPCQVHDVGSRLDVGCWLWIVTMEVWGQGVAIPTGWTGITPGTPMGE